MIHPESPSPEQYATPDQAQAVLTEVDRIVEQVPILPGTPIAESSMYPKKIQWHEGILFIRHIEGRTNTEDPHVTDLACVAWDSPDRIRTSYTVGLHEEQGLQLIKRLYPTTVSKPIAYNRQILSYRSYTIASEIVVMRAAVASRRGPAKTKGNIFRKPLPVDPDEADELITRLQHYAPFSETY